MNDNMGKIISKLVRAIDITNREIYYGQAKVTPDFEIVVTYALYKLLQLSTKPYLYEPYSKKFMGHNLRVTTDLDGYYFWIADRQEAVEQ